MVFLALTVVVVGSIRALPVGSTEISTDVVDWVAKLPRWLSSGLAVVVAVGCFVFALVVVGVLVQRGTRELRNGAAAAVTAGLGAIAAATVWRSEHGTVDHAVLHGRNPSTLVVDAAFVAFVVGCDLGRRQRWGTVASLAAAALLLTGVASDTLTAYAAPIILFASLGLGRLTRWALGAASDRPSIAALLAWLASNGVDAVELHPVGLRQGALFTGTTAAGTAIEVRLSNRDTEGSGLARRLWAKARLSPLAAGHQALGSREHLEQVALASYLAERAGVASPVVLAFQEVPRETLALATERPDGASVERPVGAAVARSLFRALRLLHDAGIAHRDLREQNLLCTPTAGGFTSLDSALPGAGELLRRLDVVQLLTTLGSLAGPDVAVEALRSDYRPDDESAVAAATQPIALAPWGWSAMREARGCVTAVRRELVGPDLNVPVTRLERFRWRTVLSAVALTVAAFLLVGETSKVNLVGSIERANFGWFLVAVAGSAITYLAAAENLAAFVPLRLSPVRGFLVQLSTAFVGVAMPPTVGHVAVNARYLTRQHVDEGSIAAAVALSQIVNIATTLLLLIVFGLLTGTGLSHFTIAPSSSLLIGLGAIVVLGVILLLIPQTRAKINRDVWPRLRTFWPRFLQAIAQPLRLLAAVGADLALIAGYLLAFIAALWALGAHPAILPAAFVYLAGNAVGSAAPTPGGLGTVEAVLVAGLAAIGIPAHEAVPAVLVFRIATFWLPIPAGWVAFLAMQRRGVL